jgi:hypothetical protein
MPRQLITVASAGNPPSMISSQPISFLPFDFRYFFYSLYIIALNLMHVLQVFHVPSGILSADYAPEIFWAFISSHTDIFQMRKSSATSVNTLSNKVYTFSLQDKVCSRAKL